MSHPAQGYVINIKGKAISIHLGQALRVPEGWDSQISRQSVH